MDGPLIITNVEDAWAAGIKEVFTFARYDGGVAGEWLGRPEMIAWKAWLMGAGWIRWRGGSAEAGGGAAAAVRTALEDRPGGEGMRVVVDDGEGGRRRVSEAVAALEGLIAGTIQRFLAGADGIDRRADTLAATSDATQAQVAVAANAAEQTSANMETVSAATEQLAASVAGVGQDIARSAVICSRAGEEAQRAMSRVGELSLTASRIGDVVRLIQQVANQTNLLALNAAIEAARAGDAGRGFAVVASEVKVLADETRRATQEIAQQIASVQAATAEVEGIMSRVHETIGEINLIAGPVAQAVSDQSAATRQIAQSTQATTKETQDLFHTIVEVREGASKVMGVTDAMHAAADGLAEFTAAFQGEVAELLARVRAG